MSDGGLSKLSSPVRKRVATDGDWTKVETTPSETLKLEVLAYPGEVSEAMGALEALDVDIRSEQAGYIVTDVPAEKVLDIVAIDAVRHVQRRRNPVPHTVEDENVTEGVEIMNVDALHDAGVTGDGARIAVIDHDFHTDNPKYADNIVAEVGPDFAFTSDDEYDPDDDGTQHGTGCAEIVADIAPDAELILASTRGDKSFAELMDEVESHDPDAATMSLGWPWVYRIDGKDPISERVAEFTEEGRLFVTSAGNDGSGTTWDGEFEDDGSGLMVFDDDLPEPTRLPVGMDPEESSAEVYIHWDADWDADDQAYEARLYDDEEASDPITTSQTTTPMEILELEPSEHDSDDLELYYVEIEKIDATGDHHFDVSAGSSAEFSTSRATSRRSLTVPAMGRDDKLLTVAAVQATDTGTMFSEERLKSYSSQGPTQDGRRGIDIAAPSRVSQTDQGDYGGYGSLDDWDPPDTVTGFNGTSAAAPHVGGAIALLFGSAVDVTPGTARELLFETGRAIDDNSVDEPSGENTAIGFGYLNAEAAAKMLFFEAEGFVESSPTIVDGIAYIGDGAGYLHAVNIDDGQMKWSEQVSDEQIRTDAQVVDGTVYIGSTDGTVYARDAEDGSHKWKFETGDYVNSSPTCGHGLVYVGSADGHVYALDAEDGSKEWEFSGADKFIASPTVVGNLVYVGDRNDGGLYDDPAGTVYALDTETGDEVWSYETSLWINSAPTVVSDTVYVGSDDSTVYALDSRDGGIEWQFTEPDAHVISATTYHEGIVYVATDDETYGQSDVPTDAVVYAIDAITGEKHWEFVVDVPDDPAGKSWHFHGSPTVVEDTVYIGNVNGMLYALDIETGDLVWEFEAGDAIWSSPTVVDGVLYVGCDDNYLYRFDLDTEKSSEDSRVRLGTLGHHHVWEKEGVPVPPGAEKWTFEIGSTVWSSPTVVDYTVYVGSYDNHVYAVNAIDGSEEWKFEAGGDVRSSPMRIDDTVYVGSFDNHVYAINAIDGSEEWKFETDGAVESSPTVKDGTVYVGSEDKKLYALDNSDGSKEWEFETGGAIESSPTVVGDTVYVGSQDEHLYAVDVEDGSKKWEFETEDGIISSPTVDGDTVYVGSLDAHVYAVDVSDGSKEWEFETGEGSSFGAIHSSPTVKDKTVYIGSTDDYLYALDTEDGSKKWRFETDYFVYSAPTVVDGVVYVGSVDGNVYAVNAEEGYEEWSYPTGDWVWSSPTVVDGTMYIGSNDGMLYALDTAVEGSSEDTRIELGTLGHHHEWGDHDPPGGVFISGNGDDIDVEQEAKVQILAMNVTEITLDGLWDGWDVTSYDADSADGELSHTTGEREAVFSYPSPVSVSPWLKLQPSDQYHDGDYLLKLTATDGQDSDDDSILVEITAGD